MDLVLSSRLEGEAEHLHDTRWDLNDNLKFGGDLQVLLP